MIVDGFAQQTLLFRFSYILPKWVCIYPRSFEVECGGCQIIIGDGFHAIIGGRFEVIMGGQFRHNTHPEAFRREAVRLADQPDRTAADVARELGIHVGATILPLGKCQ